MKLFVAIFCVAMFVLVGVTPVGALQLNAGELATFSYDFSASTPQPPYNDFEFFSSFIATSFEGGVVANFFDDLNDPISSSWYISSFEWTGYEPPSTYVHTAEDTFTPTNSTLQYVSITVAYGSADYPDPPSLSMSIDGVSTGSLGGTLVPGVPVPEPSTILLLGSGLLGLWGFRRKFKK